jgi:hypothetical protein
MLGSQRNSISRYEADLVQPSLPVLWKLYHMAEKDEKETFETAIREQIGTDLVGTPARITMPMAHIRDLVVFQDRLAALDAWNPGKRRDFHAFLGAVLDVVTTARSIDSSIPELLRLWRDCAQNRDASAAFRRAVEYLRVSLVLPASVKSTGQPNPKA